MIDKIVEVLGSTRFWAVVIMAVLKALEFEGWIPVVWTNLFIAILAPYVAIRTVDKFGVNAGGGVK